MPHYVWVMVHTIPVSVPLNEGTLGSPPIKFTDAEANTRLLISAVPQTARDPNFATVTITLSPVMTTPEAAHHWRSQDPSKKIWEASANALLFEISEI